MATADKLKYFADDNGYNIKLLPSDIDNNFKTLADNDYNIMADMYKRIKKNDNGNGIAVLSDDNGTSADGDYSFAVGKDTTASGADTFVAGNGTEASGDYSSSFGKSCKASGKYSIALGDTCTASGIASVSFGRLNKANGKVCMAFGYNSHNNQDYSMSLGIGDNDLESNAITSIANLKTTDDTQTDMPSEIVLYPKCSAEIRIAGSIIKDDYTTQWIFERMIVIKTDADGKVTIVKDENTDIVKDDTDWKFDVTSTDDSDNPYLTYKVTGKADTNIIWSATTKTHYIFWK